MGFASWVELLYSQASCVIKVGGGLSCSAAVHTGIIQGYFISDQLYSLAIEIGTTQLRSQLTGLRLPALTTQSKVAVSS